MAYNFDKLNTVNIWNINDKVREDNAGIKFAQSYGLLKQTSNCAIHATIAVQMKTSSPAKSLSQRRKLFSSITPLYLYYSSISLLWGIRSV